MNMSFIRLLFIFLGLSLLANQHTVFARPVHISGDITPDKQTEELVDANAHIIFQDGTELIRKVFDDGKHEDGKENDDNYGTVVDLPDGIYEYFLNVTFFDESENITRLEQSEVKSLVIPSLQIDTEIIRTANIQGKIELEIRYTFTCLNVEGFHRNFSLNFGLQEQICDGKIVNEKRQFLKKWNPAEPTRLSIDLEPYDDSTFIFTSCFEGNMKDKNGNDNSYLINLPLIIGMPSKQGAIMNVGTPKSQIRIPKKKYRIKELEVKGIVPTPDAVFEEGDYRIFQWNKPVELSTTKFKDDKTVRYDYGVPWATILLGFFGMLIALAVERIVNRIVSFLRK